MDSPLTVYQIEDPLLFSLPGHLCVKICRYLRIFLQLTIWKPMVKLKGSTRSWKNFFKLLSTTSKRIGPSGYFPPQFPKIIYSFGGKPKILLHLVHKTPWIWSSSHQIDKFLLDLPGQHWATPGGIKVNLKPAKTNTSTLPTEEDSTHHLVRLATAFGSARQTSRWIDLWPNFPKRSVEHSKSIQLYLTGPFESDSFFCGKSIQYSMFCSLSKPGVYTQAEHILLPNQWSLKTTQNGK